MVIAAKGHEQATGHRRRIFHVTESLASGVLEVLVTLSHEQTLRGHNVTVTFWRRPETPELNELRGRFDERVLLQELPSHGRGAYGLLCKLVQAVIFVRREQPEAYVHAHSSIAGAVIRIAAVLTNSISSTAYSPHGFAFLRRDRSNSARALFVISERILAFGCSGLVLASQSEARVARRRLGSRRFYVVENSVDLDSLGPIRECEPTQVVVTVGRACIQKAPWRFAELARSLSDVAEFVWIGDGPREECEDWFGDSPVQVTGWKSRADVLARVRQAHVFVLASQWEGMPIALIEAQCLGVPAVVSDVVGSRDVVSHGLSGFIVPSQAILEAEVRRLLVDPLLWKRQHDEALKLRPRFDQAVMGVSAAIAYANLFGWSVDDLQIESRL